MKAIAFVMREVPFQWTSCHSSLPSMILIMADKFEMQYWWWGYASSYCRGKCNEQIGRCSVDGGTSGGGGWGRWRWSLNGRLLRLNMRAILLKTSHKADFNATNHRVIQLDFLLVWSLFNSSIFDLVASICPLQRLHKSMIFLKV